MSKSDLSKIKTEPRRRSAFTLIELLVVIAIIAILAAMLLPALSAAKFRAKCINCTSNYRQWGIVATMYSGEHHGMLPSFPLPGNYSAHNPWDVSLDMAPGLAPYGLTVPMWFCPVRPNEFTEADTQFYNTFTPHHHIANLTDLNKELRLRNSGSGPFAVIFHAWWVPRMLGSDPRFQYPSPTLAGTKCRDTNGWPSRVTDRIASKQPIISDYCYALNGNTNTAAMLAGHSLDNKVMNVNVGYADGHVETHQRSVMQWQYISGQPETAFY